MPHTFRSAFTIVEALVAATIVGLASAALALSLAASGTLRQRASARTGAAELTVGRVATLGARGCSAADTSGTTASHTLTERWGAQRAGAAWIYADTIAGAPIATVHLFGAVACRR